MAIKRSSAILPFLLFLLMSLVGCASTSALFPATLNITPPSLDLPPDLRAFSGAWKGKWGAGQDTIIVIESIDIEKAEILISLGSKIKGVGFNPPNQYRYITANVRPGPILEFQEDTEPNPSSVEKGDYVCPCKLTLEINEDLDILIAYLKYINYNSKFRADLWRMK